MTRLLACQTLAMEHTPLPSWLDTQTYPFTPKRWTCPEGDLSYVDEGRGPTLLFVHGTPSWSFEWRHVIRALRDRYRCVAPDHLGFGLSDKPEHNALSPEDHARRLKAFVIALDLRDITLVVHDFGGPIGLPLALDLPERVTRVVVVNTWSWMNGNQPALRRLDRLLRGWFGRLLYLWLNVSPRVLLPAAMGDRKALTTSAHRHYLRPFSQRSARQSLYRLACALVGSDAFYESLWARRGELRARLTDIVWGMRDPAFTTEHLARWIEAFPTATVHRLPETGHFVAEEAPESLVRALAGE